VSIRYFTPGKEVPLCGHATIATLKVLDTIGELAEEGVLLETRSGTLRAGRRIEGGRRLYTMYQPEGRVTRPPRGHDLARDAGVPPEALDYDLPVGVSESGNALLIVPIANGEALASLSHSALDFDLLPENLTGIQFFTRSGLDACSFRARSFIHPRYGITEDPACGTCAAALARYVEATETLFTGEVPFRITIETGVEIRRPGLIHVRRKDARSPLTIAGEAAILFRSELSLPAGDPRP
jgi:PhzF family phenazine biosynthesis protein